MTQSEATSFWRVAQLRDKLTILIGIVYVLSPIDFIPEVILGPLGLLDDGGAILAVLLTLWRVQKRFKGQRRTFIEGEEVSGRHNQ